MKKINTVFDVTLEIITPVHIGSGDTLQQGFDFIKKNGKTHRLNVDKILEKTDLDSIRSTSENESGEFKNPAELLGSPNLPQDDYYLYSMSGEPRQKGKGSALQACIKDIHNNAYIPGSSIKGALRTTLAWNILQAEKPNLDEIGFGNEKTSADTKIEGHLFGEEATQDIFRTIQVSDFFCEEGEAKIGVANTNVVVIGGKEPVVPVEVEAITTGQKFKGTIAIENWLLEENKDQIPEFSKKSFWIMELVLHIWSFSDERLEKITKWFKDTDIAAELVDFIENLRKKDMQKSETYLQLGWGGGWESKTYGTNLSEDTERFGEIIKTYELNSLKKEDEEIDPAHFPKSRRVTTEEKSEHRKGKGRKIYIPKHPLGWVKLSVIPRDETSALWKKSTEEPFQIKPITNYTTKAPEVGDIILGIVVSTNSIQTIYMRIPGLDPKNNSLQIRSENNPGGKRFSKEKKILCRIIEKDEDESLTAYYCEVINKSG